jgi:hypothetical protein
MNFTKNSTQLLSATIALVLISGMAIPAFANNGSDDTGDYVANSQDLATPSIVESVVTFDGCVGTPVVYVENGVTITSVGGTLDCTFSPATPNNTPAAWMNGNPVRIDCPSTSSEIRLDQGDFNADADVSLMQSFNAANVLVDSDGENIPAPQTSMNTLTTSGQGTTYAILSSTGTFPNTLYVDNVVCVEGIVGGEFLPIDATALILAGAQTNAVWLMSALAVIGSVAFGALYISSKKN